MILPVAYDVFVNQVSSFTPKGYICQWTQCGAAATARRIRVLNTAGRTRRKRCYRHLVCCMTGLGYNPHTFSFIHNQPKAPMEDEGREELFMKHLFTMLLALVAATASAQDFEVDGIYYNILSEDERTVEVTESPDYYAGDIYIPGKVTYDGRTYQVIAIGDNAFSYCYALTSVEMPSVTTIGYEAFYKCSALTSVEMPSVTTIGVRAFSYCSFLTTVEMPAVETIGEHAFYSCSALASVFIPASCTSVFSNPFAACISLREITVDENNPDYTSVDGVLYDKNVETLLACPGSKSFIDIPSSVTTIGDVAFYYCSALTSVSMPEVTTIGDYAFAYCSALTSVDIPASVTMIGDYAFDGCSSLTSVYCHWEQPLECDPWFEETVLANATLYVPDGCVDAYRAVKPWSDFANIEEGTIPASPTHHNQR